MKDMFVVGCGGFLGALCRFGLDSLLTSSLHLKKMYVSTLVINLIGSFCVGYFLSLGKEKLAYSFLITGFFGSFTTFSAFTWQLHQMLAQHSFSEFFILLLISVMGGLLFVALGSMVSSLKIF